MKGELPGVRYEKSGRWWATRLPGFRGAYGQGRTKAEAYLSLLSAIRDLVETYAAKALDAAVARRKR